MKREELLKLMKNENIVDFQVTATYDLDYITEKVNKVLNEHAIILKPNWLKDLLNPPVEPELNPPTDWDEIASRLVIHYKKTITDIDMVSEQLNGKWLCNFVEDEEIFLENDKVGKFVMNHSSARANVAEMILKKKPDLDILNESVGKTLLSQYIEEGQISENIIRNYIHKTITYNQPNKTTSEINDIIDMEIFCDTASFLITKQAAIKYIYKLIVDACKELEIQNDTKVLNFNTDDKFILNSYFERIYKEFDLEEIFKEFDLEEIIKEFPQLCMDTLCGFYISLDKKMVLEDMECKKEWDIIIKAGKPIKRTENKQWRY